MATMKEIAALSDVSVATVSHVLSGKKNVSEDARSRVLQAIELTNYKLNTIAKSLRINKTHIIGVLVEDIQGLPVPELVDGIYQRLEQTGYQVLLSNLRLLKKLYNQYEQLRQYPGIVNQGLQLLEDARVDGIIYVAMHDRRIEGIQLPVNIPLVFAYADSSDPGSFSVTYQNESSAYAMTRLLIEQGHRQIALIVGHASTPAANQRLTGFRQAMDEAGLPVPSDYIRWGDWEYHSGLEEAEALLSLTVPPTAIFAMNDLMASGCYAAIRHRGLRIPEDISVVGFDNREIASCLFPGLTTVALPSREIGSTAAQQLLLRLEGQPVDTPMISLPCRIIQRDSTMPLPARR